MSTSYNPVLVALSIVVAIFASYTALDLSNSLAMVRGRSRVAWLSAGALAMGAGIWSMHFVGMLAFSIAGMPIGYNVPLMALSIMVAVLASAIALLVVGRRTVSLPGLIAAALAMGAAIAGMHYIGMWSMRMPARIDWDFTLVIVSIGIAVTASFAALWLAFRYRLDSSPRAIWIRAGGGVVMGFAIAGMHYTAMAAARIVPAARPGVIADSHLLATDGLAIAVATMTFIILALAIAGSAFSRELVRRTTLTGELSAAQERLRATLDAVLDALIVADSNGVIVEWNPHAELIFGWSAEHVIGQNLTDTIIPEKHRHAHRQGLRHFFATGEGPILNRRIEISALRMDGTEFPVELAIAPIRSGGQTFFTAFLRDLTDQKRAEQRQTELVREQAARTEAEAAERRISEIVESITDAFLAFDSEWRIIYANSAGRELLGERGEALLGQSFWDVYPEIMGTPISEALHRAMAERVALDLDHPSLLKPGRWLLFHITPTSGGVAAYIRDVTQNRLLQTQLTESQAELSAIIAGMNDVVLVMDGDGRYCGIAPTAAPLLYRPPDELLGMTLHEVFPQQKADLFLEPIRRVLATGQTEHVEYDLVFGDAVFWFDGVVSPMSEDRVVWVGRDVTERKRGEAALRAAKEEAEAANRAKSEFLSRMSHELRTPLNAILGFGQLLEMEHGTPETRESAEQILSAGKHLLALVDEVLDLARIEAGQMGLSLEAVQVREVLRESVDLVRHAAAQVAVTIRTQDALETELFVRADRQRLKQVLLNLLSNAIKYNRRQGTVTLLCEDAGEDRLRISVLDTGLGISPAKLERLFVPFDRLGAETSGVEGTGLGLALSKGLVESRGGRLGVESVEGEGSTFWLELRLAPEETTVPAPVIDTTEISRAGPATHSVLFVEDNLANVRLMERIFRRRPQLTLLTAMQGRRGLELAREHRPDLILLDLNLPDLSGDQVLLQLQQDPELRATPVVMISGDAIPSQVQRLLQLGAHRYVTKPFDVRELLDILDELLS